MKGYQLVLLVTFTLHGHETRGRRSLAGGNSDNNVKKAFALPSWSGLGTCDVSQPCWSESCDALHRPVSHYCFGAADALHECMSCHHCGSCDALRGPMLPQAMTLTL